MKSVVAAAAGGGLMAATAGGEATAKSSSPRGVTRIMTKDGTALYYRDWGDGPTLLFLHSMAMNSDMWQYQIGPFVEQGFRCVSFDRRGHGRSDQPWKGYDYDTLADDVATVIDQLDLRNLTMIGHSMGACEVVRYLTRHGRERLARIALLSGTTPFLLKTADNAEGVDRAVFEGLRALWKRDFPKWVIDNTPPFFTPETSAPMMQWGYGLMINTSVRVTIECNRALTETDFRAELQRIDVPTLVIHGDKDASAPIALTGDRTAKLIPHCDYKVYAGAPHGLFITHMDKLNVDLLNFART